MHTMYNTIKKEFNELMDIIIAHTQHKSKGTFFFILMLM
jgi:hypothetical protein